jgi:hypothetical protein
MDAKAMERTSKKVGKGELLDLLRMRITSKFIQRRLCMQSRLQHTTKLIRSLQPLVPQAFLLVFATTHRDCLHSLLRHRSIKMLICRFFYKKEDLWPHLHKTFLVVFFQFSVLVKHTAGVHKNN